MTELMCYNKGCGQKFDSGKNNDTACKFHPGGPIFHDALKGWSCCKKRSTDFTEFLSIPGCTAGKHSNEKPATPEPRAETDEILITPPPAPIQTTDPEARPSPKEPLVRPKTVVGASLKQALDKAMQSISLEETKEETDSDAVKAGTVCKNASCNKQYENEESNTDVCQYHSGAPVFHEGMKFWSCCNRKTSNFNTFLSQEGCMKGKHVWIKKESSEKKVACRVDWHQTAQFVTISIFAKVVVPEQTWVEINQVRCNFNIVFEAGKSSFSQDLNLHGVIDVDRSNVKLLGTKVEINLRKGPPGTWPSLELKQD